MELQVEANECRWTAGASVAISSPERQLYPTAPCPRAAHLGAWLALTAPP